MDTIYKDIINIKKYTKFFDDYDINDQQELIIAIKSNIGIDTPIYIPILNKALENYELCNYVDLTMYNSKYIKIILELSKYLLLDSEIIEIIENYSINSISDRGTDLLNYMGNITETSFIRCIKNGYLETVMENIDLINKKYSIYKYEDKDVYDDDDYDDDDYSDYSDKTYKLFMILSAKYGHINLLDFLIKHKKFNTKDLYILYINAGMNNHVHILKYLTDLENILSLPINGVKLSIYKTIDIKRIKYALIYMHIYNIKWLKFIIKYYPSIDYLKRINIFITDLYSNYSGHGVDVKKIQKLIDFIGIEHIKFFDTGIDYDYKIMMDKIHGSSNCENYYFLNLYIDYIIKNRMIIPSRYLTNNLNDIYNRRYSDYDAGVDHVKKKDKMFLYILEIFSKYDAYKISFRVSKRDSSLYNMYKKLDSTKEDDNKLMKEIERIAKEYNLQDVSLNK